MTEWKMSELESVKELTDSDLEKTVGGNGNPLLTGSIISWFKIFNKTKHKENYKKSHSTNSLVECFFIRIV
jgi:hypothetical protein